MSKSNFRYIAIVPRYCLDVYSGYKKDNALYN